MSSSLLSLATPTSGIVSSGGAAAAVPGFASLLGPLAMFLAPSMIGKLMDRTVDPTGVKYDTSIQVQLPNEMECDAGSQKHWCYSRS
jgi:hypothetical protein